MKTKQKGFAVLESLLIIVIIAVIGGIGWYALHTKHQTDKILSQADKISQSTPVNQSKQTSTSSPTSSKKPLNIKEWGVQSQYSSPVDIIYTIKTDDIGEVWAQISSSQLTAADSECDTTSQLGGIIVRIKAGENLRGPAGQDTGQSVEAAISSGVLSEYSHVGDYYYYFQRPEATCGTTQQTSNLQDETLSAAKAVAKNFQASQ